MDISNILIIPFAILLSLVFVGRIPGTQSGRSGGAISRTSTSTRTSTRTGTSSRTSTTRTGTPSRTPVRSTRTGTSTRTRTSTTRRVTAAPPVRRTTTRSSAIRRVTTRRSILRTTTPSPWSRRTTTRYPRVSTTPWWDKPSSTTPSYSWQGGRSTTPAYVGPWRPRTTTQRYPWHARTTTRSDFIDPWWYPTKKPKTSWENSWDNKNNRYPSQFPKGGSGLSGHNDFNRKTSNKHTSTTRGFSTGIAVGVSLFCIGILAIIIVIVVFFKRRRDSAVAKRGTQIQYTNTIPPAGAQTSAGQAPYYTSPTAPVRAEAIQPSFGGHNSAFHSTPQGPQNLHNFENPPPYDPQARPVGFAFPAGKGGDPSMPAWDQTSSAQQNAVNQHLASVHYPATGDTKQPPGLTDNAHKGEPLPYPYGPNMPPPQNINFNADVVSDSTV